MKAESSLCLREHTFQAPHGVAEVEGQRLMSLCEKPTFRWLANAGVYCLDTSVLQRVPAKGPYDMPELLAALAADGAAIGTYAIRKYWLDIAPRLRKRQDRVCSGYLGQINGRARGA